MIQTIKNAKWIKILLPSVLLLIALLLPAAGLGVSTLSILVTVYLYMYWSSAWNILGGYAGLFSLGNGIYIGLGAYITACLYIYAGITPYIGMLIAGIATGLFSLLIGYPTFRLQNIYYSLATCALVNAARMLFTNNKVILGVRTEGSDGFKIPVLNEPANMQFASKVPYYYIILGLLLAVLLVSFLITRSKLGYQFRAISSNMNASSSLGINVIRAKLKAQFLSAFFTAIGGGFYCIFMRYIDPNSVFSSSMSCNIMIMCVIGGANTLWGPVIGAALLYTVNRIVTIYAPSSMSGFADLIFGLILIACVLVMPGGLMTFVSRLRAKRAAKSSKPQKEGVQV